MQLPWLKRTRPGTRDKDFAWFAKEAQRLLKAKDEAARRRNIDLGDIAFENADYFATNLSDQGLMETIENYRQSQLQGVRRFSGMLKAEQARRRAEQERHTVNLMRWTLFFAAVGAAGAVFAIFK